MRNPFKRIRDFFRKPAMIGTPPSKRSMWHDPAAHARNFAERYAEPLNYHVENRMMELGIDTLKIGVGDPEHGVRHAAFIPHEADGGGNTPDGRLRPPDLRADRISGSGKASPNLYVHYGFSP
jgi:hypothetical protein